MSVTNQNITYTTGAPVAGGSGILGFGGSSLLEYSYVGTLTYTGDGSLTTALIQFIDGTNALPWVPTAVNLVRTGGNAATSIVSYATTITNTNAVITWSAAPGSNASISYLCVVMK